MNSRVYLDHAATTPLDPRALEAMLPYLTQHWGNPSSIYAEAQETRKGLDAARKAMSAILGCRPQDIIFTSCATESNNLALYGAAHANRRHGNHIVTTSIEHHAVLHPVERLEQQGFRVTYLPVDREGIIDLAELERAVGPETILVSIMWVNNEVGAIQPIAEAMRVIKAKNSHAIFHTDAVQALGTLEVNVDALGVDLLTIGAHKFYGPKGAGALMCGPAPRCNRSSWAARRRKTAELAPRTWRQSPAWRRRCSWPTKSSQAAINAIAACETGC